MATPRDFLTNNVNVLPGSSVMTNEGAIVAIT